MGSPSSRKLVLASQSPRRKELLSQAGLSFAIRPAAIDETPRQGEPARSYVLRMAEEKALAVDRAPEEVVVAADTIVVLGDAILGKPKDRNEAFEMIESLAGKTHRVMTAYAVFAGSGVEADVVETEVSFRDLTKDAIDVFLDLNDYADKAGAYGIQSTGAGLTDKVVGSYTNVVGLPIAETLTAIGRYL